MPQPKLRAKPSFEVLGAKGMKEAPDYLPAARALWTGVLALARP